MVRRVPPQIELAVLRKLKHGAKKVSRRQTLSRYLARRISELEWEAEEWRSEWNRLGREAQSSCFVAETPEHER